MEKFLYEKQLNFGGEESEGLSQFEDGPSEQSSVVQMGRDADFSESNKSSDFNAGE